MKSKRSKACNISQKVKEAVWERDFHKCILCGSPNAYPNAHYIPRSQGGLGIEQNIVTLCPQCHFDLDQTPKRPNLLLSVRHYLDIKYPEFKHEDRFYKKYMEDNQ